MNGIKHGVIYCITNKVNGKRYIGKTTQKLTKRWWTHKNCAFRGCDSILYRAIRKYGEDAFTIAVVIESLEPMLDELEQHYIRSYDTISEHGNGYNMTFGGEGGIPTSETRQKLSIAKLGKRLPPRSDEHRRKVSVAAVAQWERSRETMVLALKQGWVKRRLQLAA
jgi:group I intron endonuclease